MGQREFIVLIIIAVVILLVVLDIFSRLKVKETVRSNWGKMRGSRRKNSVHGIVKSTILLGMTWICSKYLKGSTVPILV